MSFLAKRLYYKGVIFDVAGGGEILCQTDIPTGRN